MIAATRRLSCTLRQHGLRGTAGLLLQLARRRLRGFGAAGRARAHRAEALDRQMNIETRWTVPVRALGVGGPHAAVAVQYQPTPADDFVTLLERLPLADNDFAFGDFTFIDLGAGKGRTLCLAAARPFRRIVGVEFSCGLVEIARSNLRQLRLQQRCHQLEVLCQDATAFSFPAEPSIVYLYNPFGEPVLAQVVANLVASLAAAPRPLFVVYYNARHRGLLDRSPHLEAVATLGPPLLCEATVIYRGR